MVSALEDLPTLKERSGEDWWERRDFIYILKNRKNGGGRRRRWMIFRQKKAIPGRREGLPSTGNLACKGSTGEGEGSRKE